MDLVRSQRTNFAVVCTGVIALCTAIAWPLFTGDVYIDDDIGRFHLPMRFFQAEALERGFDFHWFPYEYSGFHLHGEGQASLYQPFNWLLYRWLPVDVALVVEMVRNYVVLVLGGWICLRHWRLRRDAALFGAALFAFGSFATMHFMHLNAIAIIAHLPWKIWMIDVALRSPRSPTAALAVVGLALATASQLFFGHPQFVWFSLLVEGAFTAFVLWQGGGRWRWPWLGVAQVLGLVIAAVQIVPQWETLTLSHRLDPGDGFAYTYSLRPVNLVQLVSPFFFRGRAVGASEATEFGLYMGALVPVLIGWIVVRGRTLRAPWPGLCMAAGLAAFGLLMALGDYGPIYRIQGELPLLGLFRAPARYIVVLEAGLAVVAAFAFADLARVCERGGIPISRRMLWLGAPLVLAAGVLALGLARPFSAQIASSVGGPARLGYGLLAVALFSMLVAMAARGVRIAMPLMLGLALLDIGVYGLAWMRRAPILPLEDFIENRELPEWAYHYRLHRGPPVLTMRHVRLASGYAAMVPVRRLRTTAYDFGNASPPPDVIMALRLTGVRRAFGRAIPDPLPRVRLVGQGVRAFNLRAQLLEIDPARTVIVHGKFALDGDPPGSTLVLDDLPGELRVETSAPSRQMLVFAESHHPGWRAWVDDVEAPVLRVYGDFIGVGVPPGVHELELRFDPASVRVGRMASGVGLVLLVPLYLGVRRSGGAGSRPDATSASMS